MARPIVIEGPDGAGKSTLIQKLGDVLPHVPTPTGGASKDAAELLLRIRNLEEAGDYVLFDRCSHISDCIYRRSLGKIPLVYEDYLHERLRKWNPVIVYCRLDNSKAMLENMARHHKDHKPVEYMKAVEKSHMDIVRRYDLTMEVLRNEGMDVFRYDWQTDNFDLLMGHLSCAV